jgi:hypothetical protein
MAMMKANGFIPLPGALAKDSCFFVKLWRISLRPGPSGPSSQLLCGRFGFPYLAWYYF